MIGVKRSIINKFSLCKIGQCNKNLIYSEIENKVFPTHTQFNKMCLRLEMKKKKLCNLTTFIMFMDDVYNVMSRNAPLFLVHS